MEWVTLIVWLVIALLALPVALGSLSGAHGLGLQLVAATGGLVFCAAGLLGVQLPLLGVALLCSLCLGVNLVTLN